MGGWFQVVEQSEVFPEFPNSGIPVNILWQMFAFGNVDNMLTTRSRCQHVRRQAVRV